jgi:membrane peptidoglycan carboxypeptidase
VWRAVVLSEDAGFFVHHGFDVREVQDALARSGAHGRLRGASTLTQQLAKNLFLSPERTLARKVREALATIALEASASKRRLLEIYLTIAEWGPGVYGIGEAAHHWFGKDARDLSPKEAAFLATVIPNPIRYELYRRRGGLTERWDERVRDLLLKLRAADALTDEQFFEAWYAPLGFRRS